MLVFGIDFSVVTIVLVLAGLVFILFVEAFIIILILASQMNKTKSLTEAMEKLAENVMKIKQKEVEDIDLRLK